MLQSNRRNILIEHVEIDIEPSISSFEDELCRLMNKDRLEKRKAFQSFVNDPLQSTTMKVSIVERRLRVRHCFTDFS